MAEKKISLFDCISDILTKKSGCTLHERDGFDTAWNTFMVSRYLSMDKELIGLAVWLDSVGGKLTQTEQYKYLYTAIPQRRNGYIKYIAKKKKE